MPTANQVAANTMNETQPNNTNEETTQSIWKGDLPLERETCWFILVNALDVFMTFILLNLEGFRESNVIANYVLGRWGIRGMVYFKFAIVAFITVVAQIVAARRHVAVGRGLLNFGTFVTGCVVAYSCFLLIRWIGQ